MRKGPRDHLGYFIKLSFWHRLIALCVLNLMVQVSWNNIDHKRVMTIFMHSGMFLFFGKCAFLIPSEVRSLLGLESRSMASGRISRVRLNFLCQQQDEQLWAKKVQSFLAARTLIYPVSTVQLNRRVCRPCMIILREPTTFDIVAPGDVSCTSFCC